MPGGWILDLKNGTGGKVNFFSGALDSGKDTAY
jgi:hypothetical protein